MSNSSNPGMPAQTTDPLLSLLPEYSDKVNLSASKGENIARLLLSKTNLPEERIETQYNTKIEHKSLLLQPTTHTEDSRVIKAQKERRRREAKRKPRPLSARERRQAGFNSIPADHRLYSIYEPLHDLWSGYIREIMQGGGYEAKLLKADYHGALLTVTKCSCPSFIFLRGIVIKESRHTFVICTKENKIKTIPKKCTVFEFEVSLKPSKEQSVAANSASDTNKVRWEVFGEHFGFRAAERVGKKFKGKDTIDF